MLSKREINQINLLYKVNSRQQPALRPRSIHPAKSGEKLHLCLRSSRVNLEKLLEAGLAAEEFGGCVVDQGTEHPGSDRGLFNF